MTGPDLCRVLTVGVLGAGLVTAKVAMTTIVVNGYAVPVELWGMAATTLGCLTWIARGIGSNGTPGIDNQLQSLHGLLAAQREEFSVLKADVADLKAHVVQLTKGV